MRNILHFVVVAIITVQCYAASAQNTSEKDKTLLWEVSGKGMRAPSYLFGTIHMICQEQYVWTDKMSESLEATKELCMEMDMNDPSIYMQIASAMINEDGKTLEDYFSPEDYKLVAQYFQDSMGMNIAMFTTMKPIVLQTLLTTNAPSCDSMISYEVTLTKAAEKHGIEVSGLETPAEQIKLLEKIPADSIVKDLVAVASGKSDDLSEFEAMIAAYVNQDLPALYELIEKSKEEGDDMDAFLDERNEKWVDRMAERMDQRSIFFAVGAGHLWGEKGLIELLRNQGYTVKPVH